MQDLTEYSTHLLINLFVIKLSSSYLNLPPAITTKEVPELGQGNGPVL